MSYNPDGWRNVKFERKELLGTLKNVSVHDWSVACTRLGLHVRTDCGRGSHAVAYRDEQSDPANRESLVLTIASNIYPEIQKDYLKKVLYYGQVSGKYNEDDVWCAFRLLKTKH